MAGSSVGDCVHRLLQSEFGVCIVGTHIESEHTNSKSWNWEEI